VTQLALKQQRLSKTSASGRAGGVDKQYHEWDILQINIPYSVFYSEPEKCKLLIIKWMIEGKPVETLRKRPKAPAPAEPP
jgi:hypothetical protein